MVEKFEVENLGENEEKAEKTDEIEQCADYSVEEYVVKVLVHQFEVDVFGGSHYDYRQDDLQEEVVTTGSIGK